LNDFFHRFVLFFCISIYLCFPGAAVEAQSGDLSERQAGDVSGAYRKGIELFLSGKPADAVPLLEEALAEARFAAEQDVFNYLGLALHQTGEHTRALDAFAQGIASGGGDRKVLYYNSGNAAYMLGDYSAAEGFYSQVLAEDPAHAGALLNRANARLMMNRLAEASVDYTRYLEIDAGSPQHETILTVQNLIEAELTAQDAERERREQEEFSLAAEQRRIDADSARSAEEALIHAQWLESGQLSAAAASMDGRLDAEAARSAAELRASGESLLEEQQRASRLEDPVRAVREDAEAVRLYEEYLSAREAALIRSGIGDEAVEEVLTDAEQLNARENAAISGGDSGSYAEERIRQEREETDRLQRLLDSIDAADLDAVAPEGESEGESPGTELVSE
jgi:tetratricopeptide (TPR) repeat protein